MVAAFKSRFGEGRFGAGRFRGDKAGAPPPPGPGAPATFAAGDWSIADTGTGGAASLTITGLPSNGGSVITGLFAVIDGGAPVDLGGTTPGVYSLSGFSDGVPASVAIYAVNGVGAGPASAAKPVTTTGLPGQMAAPVVAGIAADTIDVDLAAAPGDGGTPITGLDLRHSPDQASWTVLSGVSDPQSVSGLAASTAYFVQTRAVNANGPGPWSASGSGTTLAAAAVPAAMAAPANFTVTDAGTGGDATLTLVAAPNDGGSAITGYEYRIGAGGTWTGAGGLASPLALTGLFTDGVATDVYCRAVNGVGNGPDGTPDNVTTTGADVTPPSATSFAIGPQDAVTGDLPVVFTGVSEDAPNSALILTATQQTTLSAAQILAGNDETGAPAPAAIAFSVLSGAPSTTQPLPTGLSGSYYAYATLGDAAGNLSVVYEAGPEVIDTTVPAASDPAIAQTVPASFNSLNTSAMIESGTITIGSGTNRMLVAMVPLYADTNSQVITPTATFGGAGRAEGTGTAMTEIVLGVPQTRRVRFHVFALPAPAAGAGTVQVSPGGQRRGLGVKIYELTDVDQSPVNAVAAYARTIPGTSVDVGVTTTQPNAVTLNGLIIQSGDYTAELAVTGGQIQDEAVASGTSGFSDFTAAWGTRTVAVPGADTAGWTWTTSKDAVGVRVAFEAV
ncbi:MAG: hypothetical protein ACWA5A_16255 [Marinibacterium sp.]